MKKQIGILLAAILILLLGWNLLSAPAVQETDPPEEDIAGSDWRTWGIINDQGTLVRGGETIDFCACVHTGDTALYYDTEDQVLLAELVYPAPVENAEERYLGMEITDRNGDGSSDILLRFSQEKGTLELLFCWGPGDRELSVCSVITKSEIILQ